MMSQVNAISKPATHGHAVGRGDAERTPFFCRHFSGKSFSEVHSTACVPFVQFMCAFKKKKAHKKKEG